MARRKSSPPQTATTGQAAPRTPAASRQLGPEQPGTVIAHYGASLIVEDAQQRQFRCVARQSLGNLVCGDKVSWQAENDKHGVIVSLQPRQSLLTRPDKRGQQKTIASNIDQIMIVVAPKPALNEGLVDRYLVAAELTAIKPVIVLNKCDLLNESDKQALQQRLSIYTAINYDVIHTSAKVAHGLDALINRLQHKTSIFVGQSGVGKSSLINQLLPAANARVGDISTATNKGRHTTTTAWLYHLQDNLGDIIDSPGIREFGLWQISAEQLADGFREFSSYAQQCKFRNCLHLNEPDCAVRDAVANNQVNRNRYDSYLRILASLREGLG